MLSSPFRGSLDTCEEECREGKRGQVEKGRCGRGCQLGSQRDCTLSQRPISTSLPLLFAGHIQTPSVDRLKRRERGSHRAWGSVEWNLIREAFCRDGVRVDVASNSDEDEREKQWKPSEAVGGPLGLFSVSFLSFILA